jgi:hypothetical protein
MFNNIQTQRKVKLVTIERETAWVVVAFLTEIRDGEMVPVSEPRVVKVILKNNRALAGSKKQPQVLALPAPAIFQKVIEASYVSPYVSTIFGFSNSHVVIGLAAQPPTI